MLFILTFIGSLLVLGLLLGVFKKSTYFDTVKGDIKPGGAARAIMVFVVSLLIAIFNPLSMERIDAGHVGIKVSNVGDSRGVGRSEYVTGWVLYNDWISKIYEFPTYQQTIEYPEQQVITKGGFSATIHPKFNYSLKPGNIGDMFSNLRRDVKEVEQGWLQTAIVGAVNDVANKWAVDDIFNRREQFETDIVSETNKRVGRWFIVSQMRSNIIPPKALQQSIEDKTRAIQEVQVAENQRQVAVAEAERKMAEARGDSAQAVIAASGRAEAIKREQISLTPMYIDYIRVQKWNGQLSQFVSGGSSNGFLMNISPTK